MGVLQSGPIFAYAPARILNGENGIPIIREGPRAQTVNVSARGAKVRLKEPLEVGTLAQLHFQPPDDRPRNLSAIVWRVDPDGLVFFFIDEMPLDQAQMSRSPA